MLFWLHNNNIISKSVRDDDDKKWCARMVNLHMNVTMIVLLFKQPVIRFLKVQFLDPCCIPAINVNDLLLIMLQNLCVQCYLRMTLISFSRKDSSNFFTCSSEG